MKKNFFSKNLFFQKIAKVSQVLDSATEIATEANALEIMNVTLRDLLNRPVQIQHTETLAEVQIYSAKLGGIILFQSMTGKASTKKQNSKKIFFCFFRFYG